MLYTDILKIIGDFSSFDITLENDLLDIKLRCCDVCDGSIIYSDESKSKMLSFPSIWKIDEYFLTNGKFIDEYRILIKYNERFYNFEEAKRLKLLKYEGIYPKYIYGDKIDLKEGVEIYADGRESLHIFYRELKHYVFAETRTDFESFMDTFTIYNFPIDIVKNVFNEINVVYEEEPRIITFNVCDDCKNEISTGIFFNCF